MSLSRWLQYTNIKISIIIMISFKISVCNLCCNVIFFHIDKTHYFFFYWEVFCGKKSILRLNLSVHPMQS